MISIVVPSLASLLFAVLDRGFDLAEMERAAGYQIESLRGDVAAAKASKDVAAIAMTAARLDEGVALVKASTAALPALEEIERAAHDAATRVVMASVTAFAGTLDIEQAVHDENERIAACAALRFHEHRLPAARAAVSGPLGRVAGMANSEAGRLRAHAIASTEAIANLVCSPYREEDASPLERAATQGRDASRALAAWHPIAETIARVAFIARVTELARLAKLGRGAEPPTVAELDACFAARRGGLDAARAKARAQIASLDADAP